jgi:hypothetical protein
MPVITLPELLESGVHFGHQTRRWNPKMEPYIFTSRNGVHIIDLVQTAKLIEDAYSFVRSSAEQGQRFYLLAPNVRPPALWPKRLAAAAPTMSTSAGWGACSPTGPRLSPGLTA